MKREMNRDELREFIQDELRQLPCAAAAAFTARGALRALPLLVHGVNNHGDTLSFWSPKERARHLLAFFGACNIVLAMAHGVEGLVQVAGMWQRRARTAAYSDMLRSVGYAVSYAAADAAAYVALDSATYATTADAISYAAADSAATIAAYADVARHYVIAQYKSDLRKLSDPSNSVKNFISNPLWDNGVPKLWQPLLAKLEVTIKALDSGFNFWLDFYLARLVGMPLDREILRKTALIQDSLFDSGAVAVNAYLLNVINKYTATPLNRVRAIFIGYGEAGKTSLINVLHNQSVQSKEEQTAGVDIHEWPVPNTKIKAHLWDFGGQVMVHATHQLFLRESCLYVLVISARNEINATEQAEYWLEHVKSFGDNAPVLIVGNRADQASLNIDMGVLQQKYPNIINYFPLSCTGAQTSHQSHFAAFHAAFCQQLQRLGTHQMLFTPAQFAVMQALRDRTPKTSFLSKAEFEALADQHQISTEGAQNRNWLLDIFDKLGVIIHFKQLPFADGYVLNPRWLTYGIYTLMYAGKDHLTSSDVIAILSKKKIMDGNNVLSYSSANCRLIMDAMIKFKLCYSLAGQSDTIIIPSLLSANQPQIAQYKTGTIVFEWTFPNLLPRHIMPELIVNHHDDILTTDGKQLVWQYGVVLQTIDAQALLLVDYATRKLQFWISGSGARDYLAVLRKSLQVILGRLTIDYEEWIVLPESALIRNASAVRNSFTQAQERAPYAQVQAHASEGKAEFIATSGNVYDVAKVLKLFVISDSERKPATPPPQQAAPAGSQITKIFLASSEELREERDKLELFLRQANDDLQQENRYLKVIRWENFLDAVSPTRKQNDYNAAVKDCDIVLCLFATKTGKFTEEEFTVAHQQFKDTGRPWIFTFFKEADVNLARVNRADLQSLWAFQDKLQALGHFWTNYKNTQDLHLQFQNQLKLYFEKNG